MQEIKYIDRQRIIDINLLITTKWNEKYPDKLEFVDVGTNRIDEVLQIVRNAANELPWEKALIEKAAYLIGGLAWTQAFSGENKRTALLTGIVFFSQNGYRLNVPQNKNAELRQILFDIQEERAEINREIIDKLMLYIIKYVSKA